jgi:gluconate 5-dehydrogenase
MSREILPGIKQFDLSGKVALVTGGSKGLGLAMAADWRRLGAKIMLVNRNADEGAEAAKELAIDFGVKTSFFSADVGDQQQTESMTRAALDTFGKIDILINSAGINIRVLLTSFPPDDFAKVMHVNVTGTWLCLRAVTPHMKKNKSGKNLSIRQYVLDWWGLANRTPYTSSKGAVVQMTRALALELAPFNINVKRALSRAFFNGDELAHRGYRGRKKVRRGSHCARTVG